MTLFMDIYHTCILGSSFKHMLTWMGFVHTDGWSVPDMTPVWPLNCPFLSNMNFKLDRGVSRSNGQYTLCITDHCVYSKILYITHMLLWLHILNYSKSFQNITTEILIFKSDLNFFHLFLLFSSSEAVQARLKK